MCLNSETEEFNRVIPKKYTEQVITKEYVKQLVATKEVRELAYERERYCLGMDTIVIYNYNKEPLEGKFRLAVLSEQKQGLALLLVKKSMGCLLDHYSRRHLDGNLGFQHFIAKQAGIRRYHGIVKGREAFFANHGLSCRNGDWVGLHNMLTGEPYHQGQQQVMRFKTLTQHRVELTAGTRAQLHRRLAEVLKLNSYCLAYLLKQNYTSLKSFKQKSLLLNQDYRCQLKLLEIGASRLTYQRREHDDFIEQASHLGLESWTSRHWLKAALQEREAQYHRRRHFF